LSFLRENAFGIKTNHVFSSISGGLIPGFQPKATPSRSLRVTIVENPEHRLKDEINIDGPFSAEAQLDEEIYQRISSTLPRCIKRLSEGQGKVTCKISSWVSENNSNLFLFTKSRAAVASYGNVRRGG
jgi:hypothetical protein